MVLTTSPHTNYATNQLPEQGPRLESAKKRIGVVTGVCFWFVLHPLVHSNPAQVQAYRWSTINISGRDCHTGTTDLANRSDALLAASRMIVASNEIAREFGGLASTGIIRARPGSVNTVPGSVSFSLDLRAAKDETVGLMEAEARMRFKKIAGGLRMTKPVKVEWITDFTSNAISFHDDCIQCVEKSAGDVWGDKAAELSMRMVSGAGTSTAVFLQSS